MTAIDFIETFKAQFGDKIISASKQSDDTVLFVTERAHTPELCKHLHHNLGARFVVGVGTDYRQTRDDGFLVDYVFSLATDHLFVVIRQPMPTNDLWINAITGNADLPGANWAEREIQDLLGIPLKNHPDPRRLVLSDDWPEDVHPLRRDVPHDFHPPRANFSMQFKKKPENATVVPVGPFFPVLEEPAYFRLYVEGETIVGGDYRGFYNHRGIEKIADSQLNYNQVSFLAERICGI